MKVTELIEKLKKIEGEYPNLDVVAIAPDFLQFEIQVVKVDKPLPDTELVVILL